MLTLLSTIISFLMGGLPKLLDFFQAKQDKAHELALAQMQITRELELRKAGFEAQERIENILSMESKLHMGSTYRNWSINVKRLIVTLKDQIEVYREHGYHIVGYGAAAKGMTLLNASNAPLHVVIDDNPLKQGKWCPGLAIPVVNINYLDNLNEINMIVFIPLAWNFYDEIKHKIQAKRKNDNDIFLRYFPAITTE